jgi:hypothetical protein
MMNLFVLLSVLGLVLFVCHVEELFVPSCLGSIVVCTQMMMTVIKVRC